MMLLECNKLVHSLQTLKFDSQLDCSLIQSMIHNSICSLSFVAQFVPCFEARFTYADLDPNLMIISFSSATYMNFLQYNLSPLFFISHSNDVRTNVAINVTLTN